MSFKVIKELSVGALDLDVQEEGPTLELSVIDWGHERLYVRLHIDSSGYYFGLDLDAKDVCKLLDRLEVARVALKGAQAEKNEAKKAAGPPNQPSGGQP